MMLSSQKGKSNKQNPSPPVKSESQTPSHANEGAPSATASPAPPSLLLHSQSQPATRNSSLYKAAVPSSVLAPTPRTPSPHAYLSGTWTPLPPPGTKLIMKGPPPPPGAKFVMKGPPPPPSPGAKLIMKGPPHMPPGAMIMAKGPNQVPPGMMALKGPHFSGPKMIMNDPPHPPPGLILSKAKSPIPVALKTINRPSPPLTPRTDLAPAPFPQKALPQRQEVKEIPNPTQQTPSVAPSVSPPEEIPEKLDAPREADSYSDDLHFAIDEKDDEEVSPPLPRPKSRESPPQGRSHAEATESRELVPSRATSRDTSIRFQVPGDTGAGSETSVGSSMIFHVEDDETAIPLKGGYVPPRKSKDALDAHRKEEVPVTHEGRKISLHAEQYARKEKNHAQKNREEGGHALPSHIERLNETPTIKTPITNQKSCDTTSDHMSPRHLEATAEQVRGRRSYEIRQSDESEDPDSVPPRLETKHMVLPLESNTKLTPEVRDRIAEQFFSILCPQQFYGKVVKLCRIRLVNADRESVTGLKKHSSIFVATKGLLPNQFFYPQLRLTNSDRSLDGANDGQPEGHVGTPVVLYEAAPGNMLFAETELEARRLLKNNNISDSCFVLEKSAIVFRDPPKHVLPIAMLTVQWIPYAVHQSEPQCPVHHKELQLFDRCTKELLCALCVSKTGANISDLVVIPDVISGDSRRHIMETLAQQLEQGYHTATQWVGQHQRIVSIVQHKKDAVNNQFDLLVAAINSKREEYIEACDASYGFALSNVAKNILVADEKVRLLRAAIDHLRTEISKPMYSMQLATVANALNSSNEFPQSFSQDSLKLPILTSELTPNLERVMVEVQRASPMEFRDTIAMSERSSHSPYHMRIDNGMNEWHAMKDTNSNMIDPVPVSHRTPNSHAHTHAYTALSRYNRMGESEEQYSSKHAITGAPLRSTSAMMLRRRRSKRDTRGPNRAQRGQSMPHVARSQAAERMLTAQGGAQDLIRRRIQWVAIPGFHGTCVVDIPIHEMLAESSDDKRQTHIRPWCLQWTLRVDDPGDWVSIGVGVGGSLETWAASRTPDLSHMWVIPCGNTRRIFVVRVTVSSSTGHAKLTIHDQKGRQLDDGHIPQWNALRSCYPQVSFGGRIGEVQLTDSPRFLSM